MITTLLSSLTSCRFHSSQPEAERVEHQYCRLYSMSSTCPLAHTVCQLLRTTGVKNPNSPSVVSVLLCNYFPVYFRSERVNKLKSGHWSWYSKRAGSFTNRKAALHSSGQPGREMDQSGKGAGIFECSRVQ